jgi:Sugar (and other) transporter
MIFTLNLGILIGFIINSYLDYYTVPFVVSSILVIFLFGFCFAADSPKHLMVQDKDEKAIMALKYYRANSESLEVFCERYAAEIVALKHHSPTNQKKEESGDGGLSLSDFSRGLNSLVFDLY